MQIITIYNVDFDEGFSQLSRYFVTKRVDSDGLKWTQLDRVGLVFGHNLVTLWSFLQSTKTPTSSILNFVLKNNPFFNYIHVAVLFNRLTFDRENFVWGLLHDTAVYTRCAH